MKMRCKKLLRVFVAFWTVKEEMKTGLVVLELI